MTTVAELSTGLRTFSRADTELFYLDPIQGMWTTEQYLAMTNASRSMIEYTDGTIEVLPMPTRRHQAISRLLFLAMLTFIERIGGELFYAPLRLQIRPGKFREPDLLLLLNHNDPRNQNAFWLGADLVIEIVSPDDVARDTVVKRADYAEARIPEYWIVHPADETITVLKLAGDAYTEHGVFTRGQHATSLLLPDLLISIDAVMDAR
ncbi:MAG: Uma2 family endonuclease [Roseiflexaceae bacterium]|nr:Uma2 family endonuclease [Roseiflexaceae bacterium]